MSYQKKDGRSHAHPSFFWYDNNKDLKVGFLVTHICLLLLFRYLVAYKVASVGPGLVTGLFSGSMLEKYGRKVYLLPPLVGSMLSSFILMSTRLVTDGYLLIFLISLAGILRGLSGKYTIVFTALQSYISDSSSKENRTRKSGTLWGLHFLGILIGSLSVGVLFDALNKRDIFFIVLIISCLCVLIVILCFPEDCQEEEEEQEKDEKTQNLSDVIKNNNDYIDEINDNQENQEKEKGKESSGKGENHRIIESFHSLFRKRDGNTRRHICTIFILLFLQSMAKSAFETVTVLYVKQSPLNWPDSWYGYLLALNAASIAIVLLFFLPFVTDILEMTDINIVLLGMVPFFLGYTCLTFVHETLAIFLSITLLSTIGCTIAGGRSLISKLIDSQEMGNIFSLLSTFEVVANILGGILYTYLYPLTSSFYPSLIYAEIMLPFLIAYIVVIVLTWDLRGDKYSQSISKSIFEKASENSSLLSAQDKADNKHPLP